ncbi:MAG: hypothetical protein RL274_2632 [Pseudomonadota bacterium]
MKAPAVYTIAASAHFAESLARGLLQRTGDDPVALSSATIYLPTRRAARGFGDAFARVMGGAALLPEFKALGDSDEDELLFDAASDDLELTPAIEPLRQQFLLAMLVRQFDRAKRQGLLSFAQSAALADSLGKVMHEVETQGCDIGKLKESFPAELAEHWQDVAGFLGLLSEEWPTILSNEGAISPADFRVRSLRALAKRLETSPPQGLVIAAGSTGSIPATAELLGVIARLPHGAVVLPGLDQGLDEDSWGKLQDDPGHPQFGLRQLLQTMKAERQDVKDWFEPPVNTARESLLRETLRPAPTTDAWRALAQSGGGDIRQGLENIALVIAADPAQEALTIALALREALEIPGRSAALVTPDRNLARRVAAEMSRWGIAIDDSAGRPLAHTAAGAFLCLLAEAAEAQFAPVPLLALLKHPFARRGQAGASFRARARELDRWCLRGPRPDPGLAGIGIAIANAGQGRNAPSPDALEALAAWWSEIASTLAPLEKLFGERETALDSLITVHVTVAQALACDQPENCILWNNSDGSAASELIGKLRRAAIGLPPIEPDSWPSLLRSLAMTKSVRTAFGQHPRLAILGPLEARLQHFDLTVLGGLNEGSWPGSASADPWFSRPMRTSLGLEQPERGIGLSAHDFAMLAASPCVLLTRALKSDGAPTIASRWLQRLEQLTRGLTLDGALAPDTGYAQLAARMMAVPQSERLARPAPRPPVEARPRRLSVTEIETWLRDPYAIYAKHVLRLRALEPLDEDVGPMERGNILHGAVEEFVRRYPDRLPDDAVEQLVAIADQLFAQAGIPKAALAVWRPRFENAAQGFIEVERKRRTTIAIPHVEKTGRLSFGAPGGEFTLTGRADRIDVLTGGGAAIVDYKSGAVPSKKQVEQLLAPQLPLEAAMLAQDGFGIGKFPAEELIYLSLADGRHARKPTVIENGVALAADAVARLAQRVAYFDQQETPYHPRVRPLYADSDGDYDHLARVREWSATAEEA